MKLLNLTQGTNEWREYRRHAVTATDFATIAANAGLCDNIYNTSIDKLIDDKLSGKVVPDNPYFKLGRDNEEMLLSKYNGINVIPSEVACYEYIDNFGDIWLRPDIMASFDGRDDVLQSIIEIKSSTKDKSRIQEQLDYYRFQVYHQMIIAGYTNGSLIIGHFTKQFKFTDYTEIPIYLDIEYNKWLDLCNNFLEQLNERKKGI